MKIFAAALLVACSLATKTASKIDQRSADIDHDEDDYEFFGPCAEAIANYDFCWDEPTDIDANGDGWIQKKELKMYYDQCFANNLWEIYPGGVSVGFWQDECAEDSDHDDSDDEPEPFGECAQAFADWDPCQDDPTEVDANGDGWVQKEEIATYYD